MSAFPSSLAEKKPRFTIEQYLKLERAAGTRHEFLDGVIYDMAGESVSHGQVTVNLVGLLFGQLRGKPCQAFTKDTKILSTNEPFDPKSIKGLFSYPDIVVVCGELESLDEKADVLLNPTVIIEVLSPSTELFDRGKKFQKYLVNPSLQEYVLVDQARPHADVFFKQSDAWMFRSAYGLSDTLVLSSIGCTLRLVDSYERVEFPAENEEPDEISKYSQPK